MSDKIYTPPIEQNYSYLNFWGRSKGLGAIPKIPGSYGTGGGGVNVESCQREYPPAYLADATSGSYYNNYGGGTHHTFSFNCLG